MSFLKRLWSGTAVRPGKDGMIDAFLFDPPDHGSVAVVGESHYQDGLLRIAGGRTPDGPAVVEHVAVLIAEPSNKFDHNAIAVHAGSQHVGYLSREDALAYAPVMERLARVGKVIGAHARLTGGWDRGPRDRGSIGFILNLGTPDELMADLDAGNG